MWPLFQKRSYFSLLRGWNTTFWTKIKHDCTPFYCAPRVHVDRFSDHRTNSRVHYVNYITYCTLRVVNLLPVSITPKFVWNAVNNMHTKIAYGAYPWGSSLHTVRDSLYLNTSYISFIEKRSPFRNASFV